MMNMNHVKPHTVPAKPVSPANTSWKGCLKGFYSFSPHFDASVFFGPGFELSVLYLMSLCFLVVYRRSLLNLPGLWSILPWDQRHHILPVGLHHWSYGWCLSDRLNWSQTAPWICSRSLSALIRPLHSISPTASRRRTSPHLTAVASGALREQDDGELIWLAAHSPIGGVIRETQRQGEVRIAEVYAGLLMPHDGRKIFIKKNNYLAVFKMSI